MLPDLDRIDWRRFDPHRDGPALRDHLRTAPPEARAAATRRIARLAPLAVPHLQHAGISGLGVDPERRLLAVGGECHEYRDGSTLSVWDLDVVRIVASVARIPGPVGWSGHAGTVQWSGPRLVLAYDTNAVGVFDPFGDTPGPIHEWYLTDGWDKPPGFAVSPAGEVFVGCWGPNEETGVIVGPETEARWIAPKAGDDDEPMRGIGWSAVGVFGNSRNGRRRIDPETGVVSSFPSAGSWSPSGRRVVVGDTVRDALTDAVLFALPDGEPRDRPFRTDRDCVFLDDDRLIAVYDDWIEVVDARGAVRIPVEARPPDWQVPDLRPVVTCGDRIAVLGVDERIRIFGVDGRTLAEVDGGSATGLCWAREDRLVAASSAGLVVLDDAGRPIGARSMVFPVGWAAPPSGWVKDREAIVTRVTERGRVRVGFGEDGLVAEPLDLPALLPELAYRVGRCAWPADWGGVEDLSVAGPPSAATEAPRGEPFYVVSAADGPPELAFLRGILKEARATEVTLQSWPIGWYRARDPKVGPVTEADLAPLVGKVVMWADLWRPAYVQIGALIRGPHGLATVTRTGGSMGSGGISLADLGWIGEAVPWC